MTRTRINRFTMAMIMLAGTVAVAFKLETSRTDTWQRTDIDSATLERMPAQAEIRLSKFSAGTTRRLRGSAKGLDLKVVELGVTVTDVVAVAYGETPARTVFAGPLPIERYDFICTSSPQSLQEELKKKLGLIAHSESTETDVLLLKVKAQDAAGLKPAKNPHGGRSLRAGQTFFSGANISVQNIAKFLEDRLGVPVIDRSALANKGFDIDLQWKGSGDLKQALIDQLGLELAPARMPLRMLAVEKAK